LNICQITKGGFLKKLYGNQVGTYFDKELVGCPIVKGHYTYILPRPRSDPYNQIDALKDIPLFIPKKGKYTLVAKGSIIIKKKTVSVYKATENFEFLLD
jgi:hypothetical protein